MNNIKYNIGVINGSYIRGWCFDYDNIDVPVVLELYIDERKIAEETANINREDLYKKKIHPTGVAGFEFSLNMVNENIKNKIKIKIKNGNYILGHDKLSSNPLEGITTLGQQKNIKFEKRKLCIVHIGMHKTGSSSIQHNLNQTKNLNFSYFNLGVENHSIPIYSVFSKHRNNYHIHKNRGRTEEDIYKYNKDINNKFQNHIYENMNHNTFVISGEDISVLSDTELVEFKNYLLNYFEKIQIVAYIRSPFSYTASTVQENIKNGSIDIVSLVKNVFPKYKNRFEKFDFIFGKNNVYLHYFDKKSLVGEDITKDFLYKNNLETEEESFLSTNESMSLEAIALLYIYNKYATTPIANHNGVRAKYELRNLLLNVGSTKISLGKKLFKNIPTNYLEDLNWIESRMNMKISDEVSYFNNSKISVNSEEDLYKVAKVAINELNDKMDKKNIIENINVSSVEDIAKVIDNIYQKLYRSM